jgi:anti-sigma B factor antagonist
MEGGNRAESADRARAAVDFSAELATVDDQTAVAVVRGELDRVTSDQLKLRLRMALDGGARYVCIDLLHVNYMDSSGLGPMIEAYHRLQATRGALTVVCPEFLCEMFEMTGLAEVFALRHSREDGLAYLNGRR